MYFKGTLSFCRVILLLALVGSAPSYPVWAAKNTSYSFKEFSYGDQDKMRTRFNGQTIDIQLLPRPGEGSYRFAARVMSDWKNNFHKIKKYNKNRPLQKGRFIPIPFHEVNDTIQGIALQAVFPNDSHEEDGWTHRIMYKGETVSLITSLFALDNVRARQVIRYNRLRYNGRRLQKGDAVIIPWQWVRSGLQLQSVSVREPLVMKKDETGKFFAYYRLQKGEAIYSSVIARFTGRMLAEEVNDMAEKLLTLNHIKDARRIRPNAELKIPLEWLSEEYVQQNGPVETPNLRVAETSSKPKKEESRSASKSVSPEKINSQFHIILDSGHGGRDPGAIAGHHRHRDHVFEDEAVHDISLRMTEMLHSKGYTVHPTILDPNQKKPVSTLSSKQDMDEVVLVNPHYRIHDSKVGVNMRVHLVNYLYQQLIDKKVPPENIILMSLHGDALHESLQGAMVYYPDMRLRSSEFRLRNQIYARRREYQKVIKFSDEENKLAAQISSKFGERIIQSFEDDKLPVHKGTPVRGYHYRGGKRTLPAILRYSKIPTSVLVEVANLNNKKDRRAILKSYYRQKIAKTLVSSIDRHYHRDSLPEIAAR